MSKFDWRSYDEGRKGRTPLSGADLVSWQQGKNHARLMQTASGGTKPSSGSAAGAAVGLLILVAIIYGLLNSGDRKKSADSDHAQQTQSSAASSQASSGQPWTFAPGSQASGVPFPPMLFVATHKKGLGGCQGQLLLSMSGLRFICSDEKELNFPINSIGGADKDGVVLTSGEKYHFSIAGETKDQVVTQFAAWLQNARSLQAGQQSAPAPSDRNPAGQAQLKPSPAHPLSEQPPVGAIPSPEPTGGKSNSANSKPALSISPNSSIVFAAKHKEAFGGCQGQLTLSSAGLHFTCPNQTDLNFPTDSIDRADHDGVILKSGKKYHFSIPGKTNDEVAQQFAAWLQNAQNSQGN